ncbi:hypothetical protein SUGI_1089490 [Cryptomeria japonica]|nr:hypothetical protein SUGI_1089490 [Cryptomeria japonica]
MTIKYLVLAITISIALRNCCALTLDGGDTLLLGDSLTGNQTLISKNGTFALGFFSSSGTKNWYIGIWYAPISQKAIVWVANRENPVRNMPGVLQFSRDGHLRLFDSRKGRSVWSTDMGQKGSRAVITDSGNFIVLDGHNKSAIVWESFAHPTNTWLPGMKMWKGMKLTSWKSSSNPASGLFSFGMDMSPGEMQTMMFYNTSVPYRSSGECTANYFTKVPELEGQKKFEVSCVKLSPSRIYISFSINPIDHTLTGRLLLDENGELQLYLWMDDHRWSLRWSTYRGQCSDFEICGAYGLCNANDVCSCVQGFTPKHDSQGWWSSGCTRRRALQCSVTEGTTDGFSEAKNQYLSEKEAVIYNEPSQRGCRTACLNNCSCTAFAFSNSDSPVCRLWFGDLFGMRFSSEGQSVFIRLAASELRQSTSERRIKAPALGILVSAAAVFSVVSALLLAAFVLWKYRRLWKTDMEEKVPLSLKRNLDLKVQKSRFYFPTWASSQIQKGDIIDLLDARIASEAYIEEVRRAAVVAGLCIQDDENERPSMSEVVKILEGTLEAPVPQIPKYLQVLVDQVDDDDRDGCSQSPISSASVPIKPVASFRS